MKFRTEIDVAPFESQIDYSQEIFLIGSCFATAMGERLQKYKFNICTNPFGVLFNPLSITRSIERMERLQMVDSEQLIERDGVYFHYDFHGSFASIDKQEALDKMNEAIARGHEAFMASSTVIITLGTMWVYALRSTGEVVANCHKMPASLFKRKALSVSEIVESLSAIVERHRAKRFIFTVSPIRHLSDGAEDNSLSKATLRVAIAQLQQRFQRVDYFPSYEIMVDDLRDYRFYAEDMVHPTEQAQEYIWHQFRGAVIASASHETMDRVERIVRAVEHRPFNALSGAHRAFCQRQLTLISELVGLDFSSERDYFESQIELIDDGASNK